MEIQKKAVDLTALAIGIIILAIVAAIGGKVLMTVRDSRLTDLDVITTRNETPTATGANTLVTTNAWGKALTVVTDSLNGTTIGSGNYSTSINSVSGLLTLDNSSSTTGGSADWNITYTWYNISRPDWSVANKGVLGLAEYGNWFKTIVIVGIAAVILAIIFMSFGGRSTSGEIGGSY